MSMTLSPKINAFVWNSSFRVMRKDMKDSTHEAVSVSARNFVSSFIDAFISHRVRGVNNSVRSSMASCLNKYDFTKTN